MSKKRERNCIYMGGRYCQGSCALVDSLKHQSRFGGYETSSTKGRVYGPYWPAQSWKSFIKNTLSTGREQCGRVSVLKQQAKKETERKEESGELF